MRRRRRDDVEPSTRLGVGEKKAMQEKVVNLLARAHHVLPCPLPTKRMAELWNKMQPQHLVKAIQTLGNDELTSGEIGGFVSETVFVDFVPENVKLIVSVRSYNDIEHWFMGTSPLINVDNVVNVPFATFVSLMTEEERTPLCEWMHDACRMHEEINNAAVMFEQVLEMCNTAGQLHRMVPECIMFVSEDKRGALQEQSKRSAVPEEYFNLDHDRMRDMNNTISKCMLMDKVTHGMQVYERMTWARPITFKYGPKE